jgi:hypothetical protein
MEGAGEATEKFMFCQLDTRVNVGRLTPCIVFFSEPIIEHVEIPHNPKV